MSLTDLSYEQAAYRIREDVLPAFEWLRDQSNVVRMEQVLMAPGVHEWAVPGDYYVKVTLARVEDIVLFKMFFT